MGTSESTMGMSRLASPILQDEPAKLSIKEQLAAANIEIPYIKGENPYERDRRERMARNAYVMAVSIPITSAREDPRHEANIAL